MKIRKPPVVYSEAQMVQPGAQLGEAAAVRGVVADERQNERCRPVS